MDFLTKEKENRMRSLKIVSLLTITLPMIFINNAISQPQTKKHLSYQCFNIKVKNSNVPAKLSFAVSNCLIPGSQTVDLAAKEIYTFLTVPGNLIVDGEGKHDLPVNVTQDNAGEIFSCQADKTGQSFSCDWE